MPPGHGRSRAVLCLVVDRHCDRHPLPQAVAAAVAAGVDWLQIRDRELEGAALLAFAQRLADAAREAAARARRDVRIFVNRRIDVALAIRADGVHLGFDALPPAEAAALLPRGTILGVSTHSPEDVGAARSAGAHYAHLAPVWQPVSKPAERAALGTSGLRAGCLERIPVLAQGGVTAARCAAVLAAGAAGVAVTGDVLLADDPGLAAASLRAALDASGPG